MPTLSSHGCRQPANDWRWASRERYVLCARRITKESFLKGWGSQLQPEDRASEAEAIPYNKLGHPSRNGWPDASLQV